jgi:anti-sigma regulatory factor (Ser/Thr protein kinase)/serine/threonine protein phosphatase PrpC
VAEKVVAISQADDVSVTRQAAKAMAVEIGFNATASEEIALVASELAANLIRHAGGGSLTLSRLADEGRAGIRIESRDAGPGITDVERAVADDYSTGGGLGYGLGAVNRLMDLFDITSQPGHGTHIVCQRWVRSDIQGAAPCPLEFGVATRPHPGMGDNGDAFVIKRWGQSALAGVMDGLGHGQFAHRAAETARQYVESHFDQPLDAIFRGVGRACRATRGVVMALARFDFRFQISDLRLRNVTTSQSAIGNPQPAIRLSFASIGNVEVRVFGNPEPMNFIIRRGVLGGSAPNAVVTEHQWDLEGVMVLHSDGLTTHWRWEDFPDLAHAPATIAARRLLGTLAKDEDDATVMIIKKAEGRREPEEP